ncbi:MAG: CRISPR-associated helicase Cas3', partial [Chthoniobacterales bacterium]
MSAYAHTSKRPDGTPDSDQSTWEPLFTPFGQTSPNDPSTACSGKNNTPCPHCKNLNPSHGHLNKVAWWTAKFAANMFPEGLNRETTRQWGYLAGLWHDLGKFSLKYQNYLKTASDPHSDEVAEKTDHATAGAQHATSRSPLGHLIATAIAGHHSGLLDARHESRASLEKRLAKELSDYSAASPEILNFPVPTIPDFLKSISEQKDRDFALSFFQRMLFSCLVDADFLATESFMNPAQAKLRPETDSQIFSKALRLLEEKITSFGHPAATDPVAQARAQVVLDCTAAASEKPGIFTLTVPTGGGKTLSSLNFALRHALTHGKRRIIYIIPFTSIIEQNAAVFRELLSPLGKDLIIEHHSNLSPEDEKTQSETSRLATENWDAPLIITTAVQFYESLYAAKTSRSRKLHNIANSVVILDEAQCLPTQYLTPCLRVLRELSEHYHTTTVLCTATQPAVAQSPDFPIGFTHSTEIIRDTEKLFSQLERVQVTYRETLEDTLLAQEIATSPQALCIVNTRRHARELFALLPQKPEENFHLSTLMCPSHRLRVLATVRQRLKDKLPVRLISTQLIEAGVDVDFPLVYRSMAGLDSIAQAAGRCNREGKLDFGQVHIFHSQHTRSERYFAQTASVGHEFLDLHAHDPLGTAAIQGYFNKYYFQQKSRWDEKAILPEFSYTGEKSLPLLAQYRSASDKFTLIENRQIPVIIPWDKTAKQLVQELRTETIPLHRKLLRALQQYTVQ